MLYFTYYKRAKPKPVQEVKKITFEDLFKPTEELFKDFTQDIRPFPHKDHPIAFRTIETMWGHMPDTTRSKIIDQAGAFYRAFQPYLDPRRAHIPITISYAQYRIPKRNGGVRIINEPNDSLKTLQRNMKQYLETCQILPHTSAYAYVKGRSPRMAVEKHCRTKHKWYLKLDFHNFFGSCTKHFIWEQLISIPFFLALEANEGGALNRFIDLCCLENELPQGTPISPWLTNQIMVSFDYKIANWCNTHKVTYTRYADDMIFSSDSKEFLQTDVIKMVRETFHRTPLHLNEEKTKIASVYGQNYILGLLANKEFTATIGNKKKERFRATLYDLATNKGEGWDHDMVYKFKGLISYYLDIEPEWFNKTIQKYEAKYNFNLNALLKELIAPNSTSPFD